MGQVVECLLCTLSVKLSLIKINKQINYCFEPPHFQVVSYTSTENCEIQQPKIALDSNTSFPINLVCTPAAPQLGFPPTHAPTKHVSLPLTKCVSYCPLSYNPDPIGSQETWVFILLELNSLQALL
jgi:hypothetical protein